MLSGKSDDEVAEYFVEQAFPDPDDFRAVLEAIESSDTQLHKYELLKHINVGYATYDGHPTHLLNGGFRGVTTVDVGDGGFGYSFHEPDWLPGEG